MSRAKTSLHAARKAERLRGVRRKEKLLLAGVILMMIASMAVYTYWLTQYNFKDRPFFQKATAPASSKTPTE